MSELAASLIFLVSGFFSGILIGMLGIGGGLVFVPLLYFTLPLLGIPDSTLAYFASRSELETCARCHARRALVWDDYVYGRPIADTHRVALLDPELYHADGQILDEVYEYGSFLQSRMHAQGVTCSDCHDAHDLGLRAPADALCSTCHQPERFATRKHHFHRQGSKGAACVACHMRSETYMVVDRRHNHSFRVPRPDLTLALGTDAAPNACNDCHRDRSASPALRSPRY